ncbi:MAG: tripartite tricarboxylate transporter TctB family protein [Hyphomicrobiales bacterium]
MKVNDAISGVGLILLAGLIYWLTSDFPGMHGQPYGPALFPRLIAVLMALAGLGLIVSGVRSRAEAPLVALPDWMRSPWHAANLAAVILAVVFYIMVSRTLGFVLTGFIILTVLFLMLRGRAHLWSSLAIAAVAIIAIQQFFGDLLRVPLPWGVLQPVAW